jgi:hypothetical protein
LQSYTYARILLCNGARVVAEAHTEAYDPVTRRIALVIGPKTTFQQFADELYTALDRTDARSDLKSIISPAIDAASPEETLAALRLLNEKMDKRKEARSS